MHAQDNFQSSKVIFSGTVIASSLVSFIDPFFLGFKGLGSSIGEYRDQYLHISSRRHP